MPILITKKSPQGHSLRALIFGCVHEEKRVPYDPHLKQPNSGGTFPPLRFPYSLHCKNAAISAPANLNRSSHIEPRSIQITSTIAIQIVIVVSVFCDMRFTPYRRGANLSLVKVDTVRASVKQKCFPGLFHIWPLANLRPASKAPATILLISRRPAT